MTERTKLIEVALPLDAINEASSKEKSIRHGHPSTLHLWWARRPLAACRAVLFGQLVDDPSAWPELFPGEDAQDRERQRLFALIEELVQWENTTNDRVIGAARLEIARCIARGRKADGKADARDEAVLRIMPPKREPLALRDLGAINTFLAEVAPPIHDPFAGGGSIPLEAQRLGLRAIATDLNPVAVLINKALIEIPPEFAGRAPINPDSMSHRETVARAWKGVQGLAEDVRYYGQWMRDEAFKRVGHLYPPVRVTKEMAARQPDMKEHVGEDLTVIAWIWARTVASPNPACRGAHTPLVASYWLSKKPGREAWVQPVVNRSAGTWRFEVQTGKPGSPKTVDGGTKSSRGAFACIMSGEPVTTDYVRREGMAGRMRERLMAVIAETDKGRVFIGPDLVPLPALTPDEMRIVSSVRDTDLSGSTPEKLTGGTCYGYGMTTWGHLFSDRQILALATFSDIVREVHQKVLRDVKGGTSKSGKPNDWSDSYAKAISTYGAFAVDRSANYWSSLTPWGGDFIVQTFGRQAIPMVWDHAEANPFSQSTGNWLGAIEWIAKCLVMALVQGEAGFVCQHDATRMLGRTAVVATDPPYYDNISYAVLSDFFYVWLRRTLRGIYPYLFQTTLTPKATELIAAPYRFDGDGQRAKEFFEKGLGTAFENIRDEQEASFPATVYYAFKQAESTSVSEDSLGAPSRSSTGWETMLEGLVRSGYRMTGSWPLRTERDQGLKTGSNVLASSILLVCRKRPADAPTVTRADFRRLLRTELPAALKALQHGNIAPVDMAQASIGPGMAIFSRHAKVLEADGTPMIVRTALQLINQALDEYLTEQEGEFDGDTRFALTWFETRQYETGPFGEAETLAKARVVSVAGVADAGIVSSAAGKVRLLRRDELPDDWNPEDDKRLTVWEAAQHLIKRLETKGEQAAADLLAHLRAKAAPARDLAYRLYTTCERKGWAEEGRSYNGLVVAWPELEKLAASAKTTGKPTQETLF